MASADLAEAIEPSRKKKSNVKYASICAILASMASVILGYGTQPILSLLSKCFSFYSFQEFVGEVCVYRQPTNQSL
jgi:hypothetical protein